MEDEGEKKSADQAVADNQDLRFHVLKKFLYNLADVLNQKNTKDIFINPYPPIYLKVEKILEELAVTQFNWAEVHEKIIQLVKCAEHAKHTSAVGAEVNGGRYNAAHSQ